MSQKKKYRVCQKQICYVQKDVEAANYEEAIRIAKSNGEEWQPDNDYAPHNIEEMLVINKSDDDVLVRNIYTPELRKILQGD
jgi:hypothetical protein